MTGLFFHIEFCVGISSFCPLYFDPKTENDRVPGSDWQNVIGVIRTQNINTAENLIIEGNRPIGSIE